MIKLESNDDQMFEVKEDAINKSTLIKNLLKEFECVNDDIIPLPTVSGKILKKIIEWCEHHESDPVPEPLDDPGS